MWGVSDILIWLWQKKMLGTLPCCIFCQFYLYGLEKNYIFNNLMCINVYRYSKKKLNLQRHWQFKSLYCNARRSELERDFIETVFNKVNNSQVGSKQVDWTGTRLMVACRVRQADLNPINPSRKAYVKVRLSHIKSGTHLQTTSRLHLAWSRRFLVQNCNGLLGKSLSDSLCLGRHTPELFFWATVFGSCCGKLDF